MTRSRYIRSVGALIALAAMWGLGSVVRAEQPPAITPPPAEAKTARPPRAKPQIIYHLPRTTSYAATLHSQAKTQSHPLPIDNSMPPSLQMSRAAANEAAARAQQEQLQQQQQQQQQRHVSPPTVDSSRQQRVKRPKLQSHQPQIRKAGPGKGRGPGASHGKGRKK